MNLRRLTLLALAAGMIALSATTASADWYDGSHNGMADKAMNFLAEWYVCGWGGC